MSGSGLSFVFQRDDYDAALRQPAERLSLFLQRSNQVSSYAVPKYLRVKRVECKGPSKGKRIKTRQANHLLEVSSLTV